MKQLFLYLSMFVILLMPPVSALSTVSRSFSPEHPGTNDLVTVTLSVAEDPAGAETSLFIEEYLPEGWVVVDKKTATHRGKRLAWALIEAMGSPVQTSVISYTVRAPSYGTGFFNGTYLFGTASVESTIQGATMISVGGAVPVSSPVPAPAPYIPPSSAPAPYLPPPSAPAPAAYTPPPASAYAPAPSAYAAPEPTPSPVAYTPPAPEPAYEPEPYVPPVADGYAPAPDVYVPDTSAPVRDEQPSYEAAYEASAPAYDSTPPATDYPSPASDSPLPTDFPPHTPDSILPTTDYPLPTTKTPLLWIVVGVAAVGGIIGGGIYLKQHMKQGVPAGGQSFSQQSVTYYIEQYSKLGYSKEQILSHLVKNGIPLDAVKQGISEYEKAHQVNAG